jgi:hypothetical protein
MGGFLLLATVAFISNASSRTEVVGAIALATWLSVCLAGLYWAEVAFVKRIFRRIFAAQPQPNST